MRFKSVYKVAAAVLAAFFIAGTASAQNAGTVTNHAFAIGKGPGQGGYTSLLCTSAQLAVGQSAADPICRTVTGDVTIGADGVTAIGAAKVVNTMLATVNSNVGAYGGAAFVPFFTVNAKGLITAAGSTPYQDGTNAAKGIVRGDGTTINCVAGVCTSVGSAATSIAVSSTTIVGGTANDFLYNNGGVLASRPSGPLLQLMSRAFGGME